MKNENLFSILAFLVIFMFPGCTNSTKDINYRTLSFDEGWLFMKDNPAGAENPSFDDAQWRQVDLPHDWSIEDLPGQTPDSIIGPFSKASIGKMGTGYTIGGTAWYRKKFTIEKKDRAKIAYLLFDGVYMNSDVWINGKHVGNHPYGYTSFYYDITPYLNPAGQSNTVAVQVKNEGRTARWYSGSGIYRHTWLTLVNPVHIGMWGVTVTTPSITETSAEVNVTASLVNSGKEKQDVSVEVQILDPAGRVVATVSGKTSAEPGAKNSFSQKVTVGNPALWSTDDPKLYSAVVSVLSDKKSLDKLSTPFGIRTIKIDAQNGLTVNGKSVKLKGGCFHIDNGPLGSAAIDRAEERKIELFKNAGYNAIRCSHNPPSPYLLDVCDRLGILVVDEIFDNWERQKVSADDYSKFFKEWWQRDLESMVLRDRNHPSIILWSFGNEIPEAFDTAGVRIARQLSGEIRRLDPTRGVTEALVDFSSFMGGKSKWDERKDHLDLLTVVGYNYMYDRYEKDHEKYPDRVMMATEFMPLNSLENWQMVEKHPYVIGNFAWVVMDYLGESGTGVSRYVSVKVPPGAGDVGALFNPDSWPIFNDYQGDIDLIGNKKPRYSHQLVVWRKSPIEVMVHKPIPAGMREFVGPWGWPDELKSWSWPGHEGEKMQVHVYTRSKLVKLELNGKMIGEQAVDGEKSITATFTVPYEPGTLVARCFDNGKETASQTVKTVGKPAAIHLSADRDTIRADRNDLSYIMVEVVDDEGNVIPWADDVTIHFEISGQGKLAGVGNGNPADMASFQQPVRKTYMGKCLAIVRPGSAAGKITVKATSEGLKEESIDVTVK